MKRALIHSLSGNFGVSFRSDPGFFAESGSETSDRVQDRTTFKMQIFEEKKYYKLFSTPVLIQQKSFSNFYVSLTVSSYRYIAFFTNVARLRADTFFIEIRSGSGKKGAGSAKRTLDWTHKK
jgi:hypothetical protein